MSVTSQNKSIFESDEQTSCSNVLDYTNTIQIKVIPKTPFKNLSKIQQVNEVSGTSLKKKQIQIAVRQIPNEQKNPQNPNVQIPQPQVPKIVVQNNVNNVESQSKSSFLNQIFSWKGFFLFLAIVTFVTIGYIIAVFAGNVISTNKPKKINQVKTKLANGESLNVQTINFPLKFNDQVKGYELSVYVTELQTPSSSSRRLQQGDSSQKKIKQLSVSIYDNLTSIAIVQQSQNKIELKVSVNELLSYVLSNQPLTDIPSQIQQSTDNSQNIARNLQDTTQTKTEQIDSNYTKITYYSDITQQMEVALKKIAEQFNKDKKQQVKSQLLFQVDATVEKDGKFKKVGQIPIQFPEFEEKSKAPPLHNPASTPVIKDLSNETEIAQAAAQVLRDIVQVYNTSLKTQIIEQTKIIANSQLQKTDSQKSLYSDQPKDAEECHAISSVTRRCPLQILNSGLLPVIEQKDERAYTGIKLSITI